MFEKCIRTEGYCDFRSTPLSSCFELNPSQSVRFPSLFCPFSSLDTSQKMIKHLPCIICPRSQDLFSSCMLNLPRYLYVGAIHCASCISFSQPWFSVSSFVQERKTSLPFRNACEITKRQTASNFITVTLSNSSVILLFAYKQLLQSISLATSCIKKVSRMEKHPIHLNSHLTRM